MKNLIKPFSFLFLVILLGLSSCEKTEYAFGELKTPLDLTLTTNIAGLNLSNPAGDGSGSVLITAAATNAITYKVDFGDGSAPQMLSSGTINYKYGTPGTNDYTITVIAVGTGGITSTISKKIRVFVAFEIPADIMQFLTGGTSKTWVTDKEASAHFGVGPTTSFYPDWYAATPNQRDPEVYDDEITFTKGNVTISMVLDNKGKSFILGAALSYYNLSGSEGVYNLNTAGSKTLVFMNATSASTADNSTRIQFMVPGNGLINFGCGSNTYEILSITANTINLRTIGADGNAWYQKLKVKQ